MEPFGVPAQSSCFPSRHNFFVIRKLLGSMDVFCQNECMVIRNILTLCGFPGTRQLDLPLLEVQNTAGLSLQTPLQAQLFRRALDQCKSMHSPRKVRPIAIRFLSLQRSLPTAKRP